MHVRFHRQLETLAAHPVIQWRLFCCFRFVPCIIGFVILFISILAELNRCPFDLPEAESELICGYNTEYSGMRFAIFYLSEYAMMFANSMFIAILFLGGYLSPFGKYLFGSSFLVYFEQAFWLFLKAGLIIFVGRAPGLLGSPTTELSCCCVWVFSPCYRYQPAKGCCSSMC